MYQIDARNRKISRATANVPFDLDRPTPFSEANHGGLCKDLFSNQSNQLFFLFDTQKSERSYSKQVKQDLLSKHQREVNKLNSYYNKQLESIKANHNKQLIMLQNQLKEATGRAHVLQANLDKAAVKHRQDITEKQKAHASVVAKKNATIQALERDQQDYRRMNFELVDEVDNAHKSAEDKVRDSVQQATQSKRQAVLSARVSTGWLQRIKSWKEHYESKAAQHEAIVEEMELE
jgi:hypothetical protein